MREMEKGIHTDFRKGMTYADYLQLDTLLAAQRPLSDPVHHDEMLFIIQHHVSELWMKLVIHELTAAIEGVKHDDLEPVFKVLVRVKLIQQLFSMWGVLETMTPSEYVEFRDVLGRASGFQSIQYRKIEFLLGNKEPAAVEVHKARPEIYDDLQRLLRALSLYDETLRHMARRGLPIPADAVERDWTQPYVSNPGVVTALKKVLDEDTERWWDLYELAEKLVDVEEHFQLWRFRHMKTVHRIIGHKVGTGGSSGVAFLRKALDHVFFPELWDVRTEVEKRAPKSAH